VSLYQDSYLKRNWSIDEERLKKRNFFGSLHPSFVHNKQLQCHDIVFPAKQAETLMTQAETQTMQAETLMMQTETLTMQAAENLLLLKDPLIQ